MTSSRLDMPLTLRRGRALAHRLALAPLTNFQSNDDGTLADDEFVWLTSRARGGFALTMTCAAFVSPEGKGFPGQLGICSALHEPGLARLAHGLREAGTVSSVQLQHSGMRASPAATGLEPVCPWEDAQTGARALSTGDVKRIIDDFVTAAVRAQRAGFEGVELHAAHGYLLGQFLDGQNNRRDDGYGGSLEDRSRILRQIIDGVRASTSADFQLGVRLSPERWGIQIAESLELAGQLLESDQLDYLDMSLWDCFKPCKDEAYAGRPLIDLFAALPRGQTRLGVAGKILSSATAQACLDHGADFVLIGRAAILHQDFVTQALADPGFTAMPRPVSRAWLASQSVGPRFIHYLATEWPDFVIKE
jgi:2,4-dienoyl-CoA reductase-like NADH-dependent reductase (Old Yellow Enzyme family)